MSSRILVRALIVAAALLLALPATAVADPNPPADEFKYTANMEPLGWAPRQIPSNNEYNSDLAFWGDRAYQGHNWGFHIVDISNPEDPVTLNNYEDCRGGQGDVIIWGNILVRSWDAPASETATCDGELVGDDFEGIHVFDVSDPLNPDMVAQLAIDRGSHTATGVPDLANNRLLVYNNASNANSLGFAIIEVPLANPAATKQIGFANAERRCHDTSVILGDVLRAACAGGNGFSVFSLGGARGGSLTEPKLLYSHPMPQTAFVTVGHAASFSWDGSIIAFGHEPGGGIEAECTNSVDDDLQKKDTMYFFYTETGTQIGEWEMPRDQTSSENCTIHNFNVVPVDDYNILVMGNYQSGISVLDFTNPGAPVEIAYADPDPVSGDNGDWSTYWYNGTIYEGDIMRGLLTWRLNDHRVSGARTFTHLNPQTQEFTFPFTGKIPGGIDFTCRGKPTTIFGTAGADVLRGTKAADVFSLGEGKDKVRGGGGKDVICGGNHADRLRGGAGKDRLVGEGGKDLLAGGKGRDVCKGGARDDDLRGCEKGKN